MAASEYQTVREDLFFWQAYAAAVKSDLSCCARLCAHGLVFIDPIPLAAPALKELTALGTPAGIVLTNANHARAAAAYRDRFKIPVYAHPAAEAEVGVKVDQFVEDGDLIFDALQVVTVPGGGLGEIALVGGGVAHSGDALIHVGRFGFDLLPAKYCTDATALHQSLEKLLQFEFELLTFAHGLPLTFQARQRLAALLA